MYKKPLNFTTEDLDEIMLKPIRVDIGLANSDKIEESIEGHIFNYLLSTNSPNLPFAIQFLTKDGEERLLDFFEIKQFKDL